MYNLKKKIKKLHPNLSDAEVEIKCNEIIENYKIQHADEIALREKNNKEAFERSLDMEFLELYIQHNNKNNK
ncbi:MAG: hypothetical protein KGZ59_05995 [Chitinophagaceae bacterium]|nr:hypothetical protein [Chitinophagaceae bacterium]